MNLAACVCSFQRDEDSEWETGIAVTTAHGLSSVVAILPAEAKTHADALAEVWNYRLDWTQSLYARKDN